MWIKCFNAMDEVCIINSDMVEYFEFNSDDVKYFHAFIKDKCFFIHKNAFSSNSFDYFADFIDYLGGL